MAKKASMRVRRAARTAYKRARKSKLGSGKRFAAIKRVAKAGGARNPGAVAASIGRKKYGAKRFAKLAARSRRRK